MKQSPRLDPAERAEMARLLPPPGDPELSRVRHRLLKDAFLQHVAEPRAVRSGPRFALFAAPVAAAVLVAAIVGVLVLNGRTGGGATSGADSRVVVAAGDTTGVARLMDRVAAVAGREPSVPLGQGQYVYVRSRVAWLMINGDADADQQEIGAADAVLDRVHDREIWLPATRGSEGLIRERGETFGLSGASPNSRYAELPTDPAELLKRIYAETEGQDSGPDTAAFGFLGDGLRESLLPPAVAAAIYRAAARIPGVVLVADSVDAQGRHGIAVARTREDGERQEWIFDPATFEYLGERSYLVRDTPLGRAGMLTGTTAVLQRAVVSGPGVLPR